MHSFGTTGHRRKDGHFVTVTDGRPVGGGLAVDPHPARREHVGERGAVALLGGAEHGAYRVTRHLVSPATGGRSCCREHPHDCHGTERTDRCRAVTDMSAGTAWAAAPADTSNL